MTLCRTVPVSITSFAAQVLPYHPPARRPALQQQCSALRGARRTPCEVYTACLPCHSKAPVMTQSLTAVKAMSQRDDDPPAPDSRVEQLCAEETCTKQPSLSTTGGAVYCSEHMRAHSLQPAYRACAHEGCDKHARNSTTGISFYCIAHMRLHGMEPAQKLCAEAGCCSQAKSSTTGPTPYCIAHMKLHGLEPLKKLCSAGLPLPGSVKHNGLHSVLPQTHEAARSGVCS